MNTRLRRVELRTCQSTEETTSLQKSVDFLKAFMAGFSVEDAVALLRLEDIFMETFEIKDVKSLNGEHLSRCIGRIAGEKGKTKNAIENATRTRIILAETKIHILGSYSNIRSAKTALCNLIMGSTPGKVYSQLKTVSKRMKERGF
jgi:RNA-binding protein PNO1